MNCSKPVMGKNALKIDDCLSGTTADHGYSPIL